jgi:hypothetical protein
MASPVPMVAGPAPVTHRSITASTTSKATAKPTPSPPWRVPTISNSVVSIWASISRAGECCVVPLNCCSARHLVPVIKLIAAADNALWNIDADRYTETNIRMLLSAGDTLRRAWPGMSDLLVTKIMLGVFGNIPASDTNFRKGFRVSTFGPKSLRKIGDFYHANGGLIDAHCTNARLHERTAYTLLLHAGQGHRHGLFY